MRNFILISVIIVQTSLKLYSNDSYKLERIFVGSNNSNQDILEVKNINNSVFIKTKRGIFEIINNDIRENKTIKTDFFSDYNDSTFNFLFSYNKDLPSKLKYCTQGEKIFIIFDKSLYKFTKSLFYKKLNGISVRSISDNYIATYSGVYDMSFNKIFDIKSDSKIREFDNLIFINYSGLFQYDKKSFKSKYYKNFRNELAIKHQSIGFSKDIEKFNGNKYFIITSRGVYISNLINELKEIESLKSNNYLSDRENSPKIIKHYVHNDNQDRILYYINNNLKLFYTKLNVTETLHLFTQNIISLSLYNDILYFSDKNGVYFYSNQKTKKILESKLFFHTILPLTDSIILLSSDSGLYKFDSYKNELTELIDSEMNYLALHIKNDTLYAGGVDGLFIAKTSKIIDFKKNTTNSSDNYNIGWFLFAIVIFLIILFYILISLKLKPSKVYINIEDENKLKITDYIQKNISTITIQQIMTDFNVSYRKLNKYFSPFSIGKYIENTRIDIFNNLNSENMSLKEIAKLTGYSISYLQSSKFKNKLRKKIKT